MFFSHRVATVATLPSALFIERFCSLGASWVFSFQSVLPPDYRPFVHPLDEKWARRLTQSPKLGFGLLFFLSRNASWFYAAAGMRSLLAVVQRFVDFSTHPKVMQQHG